MDYDIDAVDAAVLALLYLTSFEEHAVTRAWKSHDWATLDRLHQQGLISDPKSKARSVVFSDEGVRRARALFEKNFGKGRITSA